MMQHWYCPKAFTFKQNIHWHVSPHGISFQIDLWFHPQDELLRSSHLSQLSWLRTLKLMEYVSLLKHHLEARADPD